MDACKEVVSRSSSLVSRRNRADHANERSTTQCLGKSTKPFLYSLSNGRRDIVAQSDLNAAITWTASYEAFGKRPAETGTRISQSRTLRALKGRNSPIESAR